MLVENKGDGSLGSWRVDCCVQAYGLARKSVSEVGAPYLEAKKMRKNLRLVAKVLTAGAVALAASFLLVPRAHADIIKIEGPATCPGNIGSGLCNGSVPFSLSGFLSGAVTFNINVPLLGGTEEWVLKNDTGHTVTSFSFVFTGSQADNALCQIANSNSVTVTNWLTACTIVDSLGHTTSLGGTQIGGGGQFFVPPAIISFSGPGIPDGASFNLDFVSMQGTGTASVPEPSTLSLLGSGLISVGVLLRKRLQLN